MFVNRFFIFSIFILISVSTVAQQRSKAELQQEKQAQLKKIQEAEKILTQTKNEKQASIGELTALNQRIKVQENLISSIRGEMELIDTEIRDKDDIISSLEGDLTSLKKEYSSMLYVAQKASSGFNKLTFLFSSSSFNQLMMRIQYLQQYSEARRRQAEQIKKVQSFLSNQAAELKEQKKEKQTLLNEQIKENNQLSRLKKEQNSLVANLQSQEKKLIADLENSKKAIAQLDKLIEDLIKEEIEKARLAAGASSSAMSNSFAENKTKLPWPVAGFITQKFGKQNHPVLKNIIMENNGINIQTQKDETVKAIFNGEVRQVSYVPGLGNAVIIKHGDYFTVYSGMKDVYVKTGQQIKSQQEIGKVITNSEGISELRFEVRKNISALNPEQWLSRN